MGKMGPRYWFRQKHFGYGATPNTWQGWVLTIAGVIALTGVVMTGAFIRDNVMRVLWLVLGIALVAVPFTWVTYIKTEGGFRWRND
jgi:hypothetical protein